MGGSYAVIGGRIGDEVLSKVELTTGQLGQIVESLAHLDRESLSRILIVTAMALDIPQHIAVVGSKDMDVSLLVFRDYETGIAVATHLSKEEG